MTNPKWEFEQWLDYWYWVNIYVLVFKSSCLKKKPYLLETHSETVIDDMIWPLGICFKIKQKEGSGVIWMEQYWHELIIVEAGWLIYGIHYGIFFYFVCLKISIKIKFRKITSFSMSYNTVYSAGHTVGIT